MRHNTEHHFILIVLWLLVLTGSLAEAQDQRLNVFWEPREDLNVLLPSSVRIYETNGFLSDGMRVRAMYATIDLRDANLKLRAVGSNTLRETTWDTYKRHRAIFAINGGYFAYNKSESIIVSDGELVAPGPVNFTRGAFGMSNGKPQIAWPYANNSDLFLFNDPVEVKDRNKLLSAKPLRPWHPTQAVGGGPVLVKDGKIRDTSHEEGFGESHLKRHPRTAVGYRNDYTLVMMVVDGRQESSAGVTIRELAQMMWETGCYEAVNLDGGGSSAMVAADEVVNVPVDIPNGNRHSLRKNASALVLTEVMPSSVKLVSIIDTSSKDYRETGVWRNTNHANFYGETPSREALANDVNRAVYHFTTIRPDSFQLAAWWTVHGRNTTEGIFVLHHGKYIDSVKTDQTSLSSNGRWNVLGNYYLSPGDFLEVIGKHDQRKLVTDAVRLVSLGELQEQPRRGDFRIAVISDLNAGLGSATYEWQVDSIMQRIPRCWSPDLVLCGGDMVAGMGVSDAAVLAKMWAGFDQHIATPLRTSRIPFAFTIGNHDGLRSYPVERKAITDYWADPAHQTGLRFVDQVHFPHYYSFLSHDAFFVSWDASSSELTKENLAWLSGQFEKPEAKNARLRFVIGHLPLYSVAQERDSKGNVLEHGDSLRTVLEQYDVKVYISGHQHAYYPGKRGDLQLLNCGAAGSGPRRWLSLDKQPVNTVTIMDVFYERDTIVYTTYDIKHHKAQNMTVMDYHKLPSSISGVNGFLLRNDVRVTNKASGVFLHDAAPGEAYGTAEAVINQSALKVAGTFIPGRKFAGNPIVITFCKGKNTEEGKELFKIPLTSRNKNKVTFSGSFKVSRDVAEALSVGMYHVLIRSEEKELRAQLYPATNSAPGQPAITSHHARNIYGVRNIKGLYRFSWTASPESDGDFVSYTYQLSADSLFNNIILQQHTGRTCSFKKAENEIYALLNHPGKGNFRTLYHRVIASDGKHIVASDIATVRMMQRDEPPTDLVELDPEAYVFDGKIDNAHGQGAGALWDHGEKLWLADYGGALYVNFPDGSVPNYSPIRSVTINNKSFSLKPINGIGLDLDGNILVASNRHLIKIDANTGEGIAVWEVPPGKRAITSPRVTDNGEIYAMSLFAEDPNYVLKQSGKAPETFELVRTISLPQRILARTFDMRADGKALYFPDPGSASIQSFISEDGIHYRRNEDITSTTAGCNAITVVDGKIFAAARPSGVSGPTLHFRDEKDKVMWTLPLPELNGAEARGIAVSSDYQTIIICAWDKGGGFYRYKKVKKP